MPTYTIKTYYFNELSPDVQRRAWERDQGHLNGDYYNDDFRATLKEFEKAFNVHVYGWEVDSCRYSFDFKINHPWDNAVAENIETIRDPIRLAAYIWNNHARYIKKGKYFSISTTKGGKFSHKWRRSKVIFTFDDCPLTGCFCDYDILVPVLDCLFYKRFFDTFDDLMTDCLNRFFETWRDCLKYSESFDFYIDEANANEWEYLPDGTRWHGVPTCS